MGKFKMYLPNGEQCKTIDEFITYYNNQYYWMNYGCVAEKRIDVLIKKKTKYEKKDIHQILAWKIGGIDRKKTNNIVDNPNEAIIYFDNKNWIWDEEKPTGRSNGNDIGNPDDNETDNNGEPIITMKKLLEKAYELSRDSKVNWPAKKLVDENYVEEAKRILMELVGVKAQYIGSVYLFTLLYFLTKATWPIYDQFAFIALEGITEGYNPFEMTIQYHDRTPQKNRYHPQAFPDAMERILIEKENNQYYDFIEMLKTFDNAYINEKEQRIERIKQKIAHEYWEDEIKSIEKRYLTYIQSRKIDRALWAYGHLFQKKKAK